MKYQISRTSNYGGDEIPCEGAYREAYVRIDERTVDDPAKLSSFSGKTGWWYSNGINHRVENGHIKRDFPATDWFIDVDDLLAFVQKHGKIVLGPHWLNPSILSIEIYDDYRE